MTVESNYLIAIATIRDCLKISRQFLSQFEVLVLPKTTFPLNFVVDEPPNAERVVVNFIFSIHCALCLITRRWKKVFHPSRYATSTSRFTKKFTNGLTLNLITLEERPRNNKPSEYIALKAFNKAKTCSILETWALKSNGCHSLLRPYIRCQL